MRLRSFRNRLCRAFPRPLVKATLGETTVELDFRAMFNALTTGKLDLLANWMEWLDDPIAQPIMPKQISGNAHVAQLTPASPGTVNFNDFTLPHNFPDTKFRSVDYWLRGTTAFREYFPSTFLAFDISWFPFFSLSEHVVFALRALPIAIGASVLFLVALRYPQIQAHWKFLREKSHRFSIAWICILAGAPVLALLGAHFALCLSFCLIALGAFIYPRSRRGRRRRGSFGALTRVRRTGSGLAQSCHRGASRAWSVAAAPRARPADWPRDRRPHCPMKREADRGKRKAYLNERKKRLLQARVALCLR
jgi:hypothetical protein